MKRLFRYSMPYCIQQEAEGEFVVVNRDYKPLGFCTEKGVSYEKYPIIHRLKDLTPEIAAQISHENDPSLTSIYLYDDGSVPTESKENWDNYIKRLELLMQLFVEE